MAASSISGAALPFTIALAHDSSSITTGSSRRKAIIGSTSVSRRTRSCTSGAERRERGDRRARRG